MENLHPKGRLNQSNVSTPPKRPKKWLKNVVLVLLVLFLVIQFFQPDKNNNNVIVTNSIASVVPVPDDVNKLLYTACYDCHSNNTEYPWYSNLQPVGWWLSDHIKEGKGKLNFNEFATYSTKKQLKKLKEIKESQVEGWMPLESYTWAHDDAKLTKEDRQLIINWVDSSAKIIASLPVKE